MSTWNFLYEYTWTCLLEEVYIFKSQLISLVERDSLYPEEDAKGNGTHWMG